MVFSIRTVYLHMCSDPGMPPMLDFRLCMWSHCFSRLLQQSYNSEEPAAIPSTSEFPSFLFNSNSRHGVSYNKILQYAFGDTCGHCFGWELEYQQVPRLVKQGLCEKWSLCDVIKDSDKITFIKVLSHLDLRVQVCLADFYLEFVFALLTNGILCWDSLFIIAIIHHHSICSIWFIIITSWCVYFSSWF